MSAERPHRWLYGIVAVHALLLSAANVRGQERAPSVPPRADTTKPAPTAKSAHAESAARTAPADTKPTATPPAPTKPPPPRAAATAAHNATPGDTAVLKNMEFLMLMEMLRDYELLDDVE